MIEHIRWALRQRVGGNVKLVLVSLANHADATGYCWPSQDVIGEEASMTGRNVRRVLVMLSDQGYVAIERRHRSDGSRSSNGYRLLMDAGETTARLPDKLSSRPVEPTGHPGSSKRTTVSGQEAPVKHQERVNAGAKLTPGKGWDRFWELYPRHIAKDAAHKAWLAALKRESADVIITGLERLLPSLKAREVRFIPYPATWLNAGRWADDDEPPEEPRKPTGTAKNGGPRVPVQNEWEYNR